MHPSRHANPNSVIAANARMVGLARLNAARQRTTGRPDPGTVPAEPIARDAKCVVMGLQRLEGCHLVRLAVRHGADLSLRIDLADDSLALRLADALRDDECVEVVYEDRTEGLFHGRVLAVS